MEPKDELQNFVKELFTKGGFSPEDIAVRPEPDGFGVDIQIPDAGLAIGEDGAHLLAWEHVIRSYAQKIMNGRQRISFDINHYRAIKDEALKEIARKAARDAVLGKKAVELPPMNAYERRVVHSELALRPDVATESTGEEPNRRVVVKPI